MSFQSWVEDFPCLIVSFVACVSCAASEIGFLCFVFCICNKAIADSMAN